MNNAEFQLRGFGDPRLAVHATSALPAWLWSVDGTRILWANPVGAALFGAANSAVLAEKNFGPADANRRQVVQLATRLIAGGAIRLERLRGFGAPFGRLVTCGCTRLDFSDGSQGILIAAAEPVGRAMPLVERLQRLIEGVDTPVAAFARDGMLVGASNAARSLPGLGNLSDSGLDDARSEALQQGRAETAAGIGHMVLQRVGSGADTGLVALITSDATPAADLPMPDYEQAAISGEAPAEFALIDEFQDTPVEAAAAEPAAIDAPAEPDLISVLPPDTPHLEAPHAEAPAPTAAAEVGADEPSPYVEAVADEPAAEPAAAIEQSTTRATPLRFMWQMDPDGRFTLGSDEFTRLIGARTAAGFGRLWSEIADSFGLDPEARVVNAIATRNTWSGITLNWPVDGGERLPVELSGLPVFDRDRNFAGYRGFGVCRDLEGLARLADLRRQDGSDKNIENNPMHSSASDASTVTEYHFDAAPVAEPPPLREAATSESFESAPIATETSPQTDLETPVETPSETYKEALKNVLPFRPISEPKAPVLTPVENSAFNELARQLSARLDNENDADGATPTTPDVSEASIVPPAATATIEPAATQLDWLAHPEPPARGETKRDRMLLDLIPAGVLIYRLDRLLYANPAFLTRMGYASLQTLEEAGGLDALYVEPGVSTASSTSEAGTPVTISASQASPEHAAASATDARLFTISWDDDSALALICSGAATQGADAATDIAAAIAQAVPVPEPSAVGHANAEELGAILDTTAEGIVMFDASGNLNSCNRSAEALFGYDGAELVQKNIAELFAPESVPAVLDYLAGIKRAGVASLLDHGRDVLGQVRGGGLIPLSMTIGRTLPDGPNFFAVFRDLSQVKKSESELQQARRLADRAGNAKADMLARISHEVRTPLNAIIGFAEVMIAERFGKLGNERYVEYMKDIRISGERVIAIINDLLDLSRIETGKLDLVFASQNLNDLVESCVAVMQPQANRGRIIIRTSLAHMLPSVVADARALRQITLNLIGNSIHLANAGGQVIVSTALSDFGEVVLRVRDTGHGLNDNEVAAAMEPFRTQPPSDQASENSGVSLSLTKALVEANRAQFHIRTGAHAGTLIEVVFSHAMAKV
jgi:PAS domain S-box-containing protein